MRWDASAGAADQAPAVLRGRDALAAEQQRLVSAADTFFMATSYDGAGSQGEGAAPNCGGCDASHRGGPPGFVRVLDGGRVLLWPDYIGNFMFQTLGEPALHPKTLGLEKDAFPDLHSAPFDACCVRQLLGLICGRAL